MSGLFATFEGGEGVGKTTQIRRLAERLRAEGYGVERTREPGGTAGAEAVRHVVLGGAAKALGVEMEAALFAAARRDNVELFILPALRLGRVVLCDRYVDSSRVYQGAVGGVNATFMTALEAAASEGARPDVTLIFDLPAERALARMRERQSGEVDDRYEREGLDAHRRRRDAFRRIAQNEPRRCRLIDADRTEAEIAEDVWAAVEPLLERKRA